MKQFPFGDYLIDSHNLILHGRRLKGKGKGVLGVREMRGTLEKGGRETPAGDDIGTVFCIINVHLA